MFLNLSKLISKYDIEINGVIHIGAHYGQEYKDYVRNNIENMMFFEPLSDTFRVLSDNIQQGDNVKLFNTALGNVEGEIDMFTETANNGQSSSVLEPQDHLKQYKRIKFDGKETVKINKLDNIAYDRAKYNLINIDVQGYELEVFKGAIDSLWPIAYIITEINRAHLYKDCALAGDLDAFLSEFGFVRVETYWVGKTWGDALYLRNYDISSDN